MKLLLFYEKLPGHPDKRGSQRHDKREKQDDVDHRNHKSYDGVTIGKFKLRD
jgi:hypothetical protein